MKCLNAIDAKILEEEFAKLGHQEILEAIKEYCQTHEQFSLKDVQFNIFEKIAAEKKLTTYLIAQRTEDDIPLAIYLKSIANKMKPVMDKLCHNKHCQRTIKKGEGYHPTDKRGGVYQRLTDSTTWELTFLKHHRKSYGTKTPTKTEIEKYSKNRVKRTKSSDEIPLDKRQKQLPVEQNQSIPSNEAPPQILPNFQSVSSDKDIEKTESPHQELIGIPSVVPISVFNNSNIDPQSIKKTTPVTDSEDEAEAIAILSEIFNTKRPNNTR